MFAMVISWSRLVFRGRSAAPNEAEHERARDHQRGALADPGPPIALPRHLGAERAQRCRDARAGALDLGAQVGDVALGAVGLAPLLGSLFVRGGHGSPLFR